jgi:hypothetical protein
MGCACDGFPKVSNIRVEWEQSEISIHYHILQYKGG